jgi:hypothetical protein
MRRGTTVAARLSAWPRREAGQAMVEFALVVLFIFIVFISILQMILLMYAYNTLADAAKEGVRYAVVHGTGLGTSNCSGPGNPPTAPACADPTGTNVANWAGNFAGLSIQPVVSTNNGCTTSSAPGINVCYDPNGANTNSSFGQPCSAPGCMVRVTVSHTYAPLFGLSWPTITLNAAADGYVMN